MGRTFPCTALPCTQALLCLSPVRSALGSPVRCSLTALPCPQALLCLSFFADLLWVRRANLAVGVSDELWVSQHRFMMCGAIKTHTLPSLSL